jgi:hypothetical protein
MDLLMDTADLDPGSYRLMLSQVDGKTHDVHLEVLTAPPTIDNLPLVLNQGASTGEFVLKGKRLDELKRLEVARGNIRLAPAASGDIERGLTVQMPSGLTAGSAFAIKAYVQGRSEPLVFSDAVRIVGPRPKITGVTVSKPPDQSVQLDADELPGGVYVSAMLTVEHLQSNSIVKLGCRPDGTGSVTLPLGGHLGPVRAQQVTPNQVFLSFDTGAWPNGCVLEASVTNGGEGESAAHRIGTLVLAPHIDALQLTLDSVDSNSWWATLTGKNLETIERIGWTPDRGEPVAGLPLAVGDGQKQKLQTRIDPPPDPGAPLFLWLRNESKPRATMVRAAVAPSDAGQN